MGFIVQGIVGFIVQGKVGFINGSLVNFLPDHHPHEIPNEKENQEFEMGVRRN